MADFFISYTQADRPWAEWIAWVLEAAGFSATIQAWDYRPGGNFVADMQAATATAERTIAVLSPDYLKSGFGLSEWAAAFAQDPTGRDGKLVPVRARPVDLNGLLSQIVHFDLFGLNEAGAKAALLAGIKRGRLKPDAQPGFPGTPRPRFPADLDLLPEGTIPEIGPLPPGSRMPFAHNPLFVGREEDLRTLARQLKAGETSAVGEVQIAAATGLGGMGKTQLAVELVHRYGRYFEGGVFWMSFADPNAVPAEVAASGRNLDLHPSYDTLPLEQQLHLVEREWQEGPPRLLIFDNCED